MPATMQQTTIDQVDALEPTVTFDRDTLTINATVVAFNDANGKLRIKPPMIAVPGTGSATPSVWTVIWTVVPDTNSIASAVFKDSGIVILSASSSFPDNVFIVSEVAPVPANPLTQRQVTISNGCTDANSFGYDISVCSGPPSGVTLFFFTADQAPESRTIDPTIVVVKDPIG